MLHLTFVLVIALEILGVQSRAQGSSGTDSLGLGAFPTPNCICTPFFRCHDAETSSDTFGIVDDRIHVEDNRPVITVRQESEPGVCPDLLDVCCHNLIPTLGMTPRTNISPPTRPPRPPQPNRPQTTETVPTTLSNEEFLSLFTPAGPAPQTITSNGACGVRNMDGAGFSISGFTEGQAQYGEFPWSVALLTSNTGFGSDEGVNNLFVGGGSLIHPRVVLTAGHKIFDNGTGKELTARIGEWNFRATNEPIRHQDIPVSQIIYHPRFNRKKSIYNLALLVLERTAELGETVRTICLPSDPGQRFDGKQCILSGWGKDIFGEAGRYQRILKSVSVNMVDHFQCQSALQGTTRLGSSFKLDLGNVCAGDQGEDACTGDGGSPLVCADPMSPGQYVQVGVASWGIGCGQTGIPGVYAAVAPAIEWIQETLDTLPNFDVRLGAGSNSS